jgi:AhpD family alkylhydroperoxidase
VPGLFSAFPEVGIAGAWEEFKSVQLNPDTELDGKTKELLGLAVAAQIPCAYCVYFHTAAAKANGATDEEIKEAVAMAAIVRHWSTVLNGMQVDLATFQQETDDILKRADDAAAASN